MDQKTHVGGPRASFGIDISNFGLASCNAKVKEKKMVGE